MPARQPEPLVVPKITSQCWSMDFMSDRLENNVRFRTFNVIDDCNRELLGIDIGTGLPSARVTRYLDKPNSLVFTHQTETKEVVKTRDKTRVKVGYKNSTRLKRKST